MYGQAATFPVGSAPSLDTSPLLRFGASAEKPALRNLRSFLKPHLTPFSTLQRRKSKGTLRSSRALDCPPFCYGRKALVLRTSAMLAPRSFKVRQSHKEMTPKAAFAKVHRLRRARREGKSAQTGGRRKPRGARVAPPTTHNEEPKFVILS